MKKIMMAAMVMLAALTVSCQKEENGVENLPTFTAHADNGGMKTDLVGNLIHWNSTDQVKVFGNSGYAIYGVTPRSDDPTWATLTPVEDYSITGSLPYRFVYPACMAEGDPMNNSLYVNYPAERNINDAPLKYYPMYGESDQGDVVFHNLGGLVRIVLPQIDREVAFIRVAADVAITGKYSFAADCSTMSHVGESVDTSIAIVVNGNISEGDEVYVSMPNGQYSFFDITIYTTDGYMARKIGRVNVAQSAITTVAVSNLSFTVSELVVGLMERAFSQFNENKPIIFHYNYYYDGENAERIDDGQTGIPIWRKINPDVVDIYTPAAVICAPANCSGMFYNCGATSIDFGDGFSTQDVTDMSQMFRNCGNLTSLDLSSFNTTYVMNMGWMFRNCQNLTSLDLSSFTTANVTDMSWMFQDCPNLTSLDLSSFNTENVMYMEGMFQCCEQLTSLDLSSFSTSNVTCMDAMFCACFRLTSLNISSFNTANVTGMSGMFMNCENLASLDLSSFTTANVTDMSRMFYGCRGLRSLDFSSFTTANVTDMCEMFEGCHRLPSLDLSSFNIANVTDMRHMFRGCSNIISIEFASTATINSSADIGGMLDGLGRNVSIGCTIHCNESVKNRLMSSGTEYNATYVHFNTVY